VSDLFYINIGSLGFYESIALVLFYLVMCSYGLFKLVHVSFMWFVGYPPSISRPIGFTVYITLLTALTFIVYSNT